MSLEIKTSFLKDLECALSDRITATALSSTLSAVADVLEHYEFSRILRTEESYSLDLMETYINAMKIQGLSSGTIFQYTRTIRKLLDFAKTPIRNITVHHIRSWLAKEKERGISNTTLNNNRQVFSAMFGWLWREGLIEKNPLSNVEVIKTQKKVKEAYQDVDIEKLKNACNMSRLPTRDITIISFLLATGCRVSEVVGLNRDDINLIDKEAVVLGKGNKERPVYFDAVTAMYLKRYLDSRKDFCPALFANHHKNRLTQEGIRSMLCRRAKDAGVDHVHPHKFRRTLATILNAHGMPIQEIAAILGHENLDTTMKYIVLNKAEVKHSYQKYA